MTEQASVEELKDALRVSKNRGKNSERKIKRLKELLREILPLIKDETLILKINQRLGGQYGQDKGHNGGGVQEG